MRTGNVERNERKYDEERGVLPSALRIAQKEAMTWQP